MWPVVLVLTGWEQIYGSTIWVKYLKNNSLFLHLFEQLTADRFPLLDLTTPHHFFLLLVHSRTLLADCFSRSIQKLPNFHSSLPISRQKSHIKKKRVMWNTLGYTGSICKKINFPNPPNLDATVGVYLVERVMVTSLALFKDADNKGVATIQRLGNVPPSRTVT